MVYADITRRAPETATFDRDQIQLALAIADESLARSLLTDCLPALAQPHQIGSVRLEVGIPSADGHSSIDGVVEYEQIWCALAAAGQPAPKDYATLTRCQSELQTLAWRMNLSEAIALLSHGGFDEDDIQRLLQLPWDGWHRSWWDVFDAQGRPGLPFQRWFRTRCYGDGTYTLQYRDHYAQDAPPCFGGSWQRVPLIIAHPEEGFGTVLTRLRSVRAQLDADRVILLSEPLNTLTQEGFIRQGINLYSIHGRAMTCQMPCLSCDRHSCPFNGRADSPVVNCRHFSPSAV